MPTAGHESPPGIEYASVLRERVARHVVENQIVARLALREVRLGVVDDMVRALNPIRFYCSQSNTLTGGCQ